MKRRVAQRLERFAVMLWEAVAAGTVHGPEVERERLMDAADAMHAARMVLTGHACHLADTLCELAWMRVAQLDREIRRAQSVKEGAQ